MFIFKNWEFFTHSLMPDHQTIVYLTCIHHLWMKGFDPLQMLTTVYSANEYGIVTSCSLF